MMAMAVGGRWGRLEEGEAQSAGDVDGSTEESEGAVEPQVIEPSEVRPESDPWSE